MRRSVHALLSGLLIVSLPAGPARACWGQRLAPPCQAIPAFPACRPVPCHQVVPACCGEPWGDAVVIDMVMIEEVSCPPVSVCCGEPASVEAVRSDDEMTELATGGVGPVGEGGVEAAAGDDARPTEITLPAAEPAGPVAADAGGTGLESVLAPVPLEPAGVEESVLPASNEEPAAAAEETEAGMTEAPAAAGAEPAAANEPGEALADEPPTVPEQPTVPEPPKPEPVVPQPAPEPEEPNFFEDLDEDLVGREPSRRWIDATGTVSVVGRLVEIAADGRCLLESGGRRWLIPVANLSDHDRQYVRQAGPRLARSRRGGEGRTVGAAPPAETTTAGL